MQLDSLNEDVLGAVRQNLGCEDPDDDSRDNLIGSMEPIEVFRCYLEWEGIIGYAQDIWDAVASIKLASGEHAE